MKTRNIKAVQMFMAVAVISLLAGCAHYRAQPLNRTIAIRNSSQTKDQHIALDYHIFNKNDCHRYLDRDVIAAGYQPIHISLHNNTDRCLHVSPSGFDIPVVTPEDIADQFHTSTAGRSAGYGVACFLTGILPLAIPAIVDGVKSSKANKRLDIDFSRKSFKSCVLHPGSSTDGLIFVPIGSFDGEFSLQVTDRNNNERFTLSSSSSYVKVGH